MGSTIFWLGILTTATLAARALSIDALANGLESILAYVPHVLIASIVLFVGVAVANLVANLLAGTASNAIARIARAAIVILAAFMALDQLGIARNVVMTVFTAAAVSGTRAPNSARLLAPACDRGVEVFASDTAPPGGHPDDRNLAVPDQPVESVEGAAQLGGDGWQPKQAR